MKRECDRFAMIQLNDGCDSVTEHLTEDDAYNDIIDTCLEHPSGWLGDDFNEDEPDGRKMIKELEEARETMTPEQVYNEYIVDNLEGPESGFFMWVLPLHRIVEEQPCK